MQYTPARESGRVNDGDKEMNFQMTRFTGHKKFLITLGVGAIAAVGSISAAVRAGLDADAQRILGSAVSPSARMAHPGRRKQRGPRRSKY